MKVLLVSTDRKIFENGSAVRQRMIEYGSLFERLEIVVFSNKSVAKDLQAIKLSENTTVYPTNSRNKIFYIFDAFVLVKKIIRTSLVTPSDLVVSVQDPFETGLVGLFLKLFYKLPLHVQIHTDFANRYFITHSILNLCRFIISHLVLNFADAVRVVSTRVGRHVQIASEYMTVLPIYNELDLAEISPKQDKPSFLAVARLEREKNLETAIDAFKKVIGSGIDAEFTIVGDGSERRGLELRAKRLGLQDKIRFVGWQNDVSTFYKDANIYISTSLYEGYGMSIVEATLNGLALVISDTGVAGDVLVDGQDAFVLKPKDEAGFVDKMKLLSENKNKRKELALNANQKSREFLISKEEYLDKYVWSIKSALTHKMANKSFFARNMLARYFVAGITGASTQIGTLYLFTELANIWYLYSSIISFGCALIISFTLQKFWTFADRDVRAAHRQFGKYAMVAILGVLINTSLMYLLVDIFKIWYIFAQVVIGGVVAILNFLMYKFFIFQSK